MNKEIQDLVEMAQMEGADIPALLKAAYLRGADAGSNLTMDKVIEAIVKL